MQENIESHEIEQPKIPPKNKFKAFLKEFLIPLVMELLIVLLLIKYVFFLANVPTGSMLPTIAEESWIFSTHIHNPAERIERGDIIVFNGVDDAKVLIKRCIGMPGETIRIDIDGNVYVNGALLDEPYVIYPEGGREQEFVVPADSYLFFGDNRAGSADARSWSNPYIPAENIIGEAHFTLYPFSNFGFLE